MSGGPAKEAPRILIIEDDLDFRNELEEMLQREGFECRVAKNAEGARMVLKSWVIPDLVILDLGLESGRFGATEQTYCMNLRRQLPGVAFIALSGAQLTGEEGFELSATKLVDAFIYKGNYKPASFVSRMRELLPSRPADHEIGRGTRVFISYSHDDLNRVTQLATDLQEAGFEVWYDREELKSGDNLVEGVLDALERSNVVVAVLSSLPPSKWVRYELSAAVGRLLSGHIRRIIPVRIDKVPLPSMLKTFEAADFFSDYQKGLKSLIAGLRPPDQPPAT